MSMQSVRRVFIAAGMFAAASGSAQALTGPAVCNVRPAFVVPTTIVSADSLGLCLLCGVTDPKFAADGLSRIGFATFARMHNTVGVAGGSTLSLIDTLQTISAPARAGFIVKLPEKAVLRVNLLGSIKVTTVNNGIDQQSATGATLKPLVLLSGTEQLNRYFISVDAKTRFDTLRIDFKGLVGVNSALDVYSACVHKNQPLATDE